MRLVKTFVVTPRLPERLAFLAELANNLWWCWNHDAIELLRRVDRRLWLEIGHDPVRLLGQVPQDRLERRSRDEGFLAHLDRVEAQFRRYMKDSHWFNKHHGEAERQGKTPRIAYFSLEFGLAESVPLYSGGLGVLAGDHLKSASDLGIPLVAMGLLYNKGYFRQYLNADGWQQELYPEIDLYNMPLKLAKGPDGEPVRVDVSLGDRTLYAQVWKLAVGRVPLFLLDANLPENAPEDRVLTDQLYGGDRDTRIRQEILLGIGGYRALVALGIEPTVYHMNEGHSAFLAFEQIRQARQRYGLSYADARELVSSQNVFTTHTPVPAGNERFMPDLMERYLHDYHVELGLSCRDFLALGRENPDDPQEPFCMTVLALRLADHSNGVSKLHGEVSRTMWKRVWPEVPEDEIPIHSVTNGVHTQTWISDDLAHLFETYLGHRWGEDPSDESVWEDIEGIPDEELWRVHTYRRERLVAFARRRLKVQLRRRGLPEREADVADEVLDPAALTIGFARRFATYKRASLIFQNMERLRRILLDRDRPVQLVFAGKAHPMDRPGKELIRRIIHMARDPELRRRIVFIEDYDMRVGRSLVQGVDVWLNNPLRPKEASGTSGMKAAANGALNLSVLDGWWVEGYRPDRGWAIGRGEVYPDLGYQDEVESNFLYDLIERDIVPTFYERGRDRLPRAWIARMKSCIAGLVPYFNTHRMLAEYTELCYLPANERFHALSANSCQRARSLNGWKEHVRRAWGGLEVVNVSAESSTELPVGDALRVSAQVFSNGLGPEDLAVELYHGPADAQGEITDGVASGMHFVRANGDGLLHFTGTIPCVRTGRHAYTVRILPRHEDLTHPYELWLIRWA